MTRIQKQRSCSNCRYLAEGGVYTTECNKCRDLSNWKSRRGAPPGRSPKPGDKKTGPKKFEDRGELRQFITLSFTGNDIKKAGGYWQVKADLEKAFYDKIK
jgi:hypothetical protein